MNVDNINEKSIIIICFYLILLIEQLIKIINKSKIQVKRGDREWVKALIIHL